MLLPDYIAPSWEPFLTDEIRDLLAQIETEIGDNYTPSKAKSMRFLTLDLDQMKVCIVGQDVYFQPGVATGRSFEVGGLERWDTTFKQVSLKNIIRLIHKSYNGITAYEEIKKFSEILKEIKEGQFPLLDPPRWFESLEAQGVLFLNTYLTCEMNKPNSHRLIWKTFSIHLFNYISERRPDLIWFLWGSEAISNKAYIKEGIIYESRHPMMCSNKYDEDFLKAICFKETQDMINWLG